MFSVEKHHWHNYEIVDMRVVFHVAACTCLPCMTPYQTLSDLIRPYEINDVYLNHTNVKTKGIFMMRCRFE